MGLFADTIRDAHRPLNSHSIRRAAIGDEDYSQPVEDPIAEDNSGMQTVFRFQKAESPVIPGRFQEASFRQGRRNNPIPSGDPLTAGTEAERPQLTAHDVGKTDISVEDDSGGSELETGQEESISPSKIEAASMASDSRIVQSFISSGLVEKDFVHVTRQSEIPEGSRQPVSRQSEAFESRPAGRGAPSETHTIAPANKRTSRSIPLAAPMQEYGHRIDALKQAMQPDQLASDAAYTNHSPDQRLAATPGIPEHISQATGRKIETEPHGLDQTNSAITTAKPSRPAFEQTPFENRQSVQPEPPSLVIGRIDVTVVSTNKPSPESRSHRDDSGSFLSRNYLKRI